MQFRLSDSPLRNFNKYDSDNIFDLLLPFARSFCSAQHTENDSPIPPSAFVLRGGRGSYFNGYDFRAPEDFLAELSLEAQSADAIFVMTEVGSMSQDFSQGLVVLCAQTRKFYRCRAFSLVTGEGFDLLEDPLRIELPPSSDAPDDANAGAGVCHLLGVEPLLHPLF